MRFSKNMIRLLALLMLMGGGFQHLFSQSELDGLRFSTTTITGSARSLGLAGAASAMGADFSSATLNPAGLGLYRKNDISITPAFRSIENNSEYLNGSNSAKTNNFGIASFGASIYGKVYDGYGANRYAKTTGLKSYTISLGYNQVENYYRKTDASGYNPHSSITMRYAELAQGIPASDLEDFFFNSLPGLAWESFAIDWIYDDAFQPVDGQYWGVADSGKVQQTLSMEEEGVKNEWFLAGGINVDDFWYFGLTIGIQSLRYSQSLQFTEEDTEGRHNFYEPRPTFDLEFPFDRLSVSEQFTTTGSGVNARLGMIVRPTDNLRIGLSFQTPTALSLRDNFGSTMEHNFASPYTGNDTIASARTDGLQSSYRVNTPYTFTLGGMYLLGKSGFITADVEMVDYAALRLRDSLPSSDPNYYDYEIENGRVKELYQTAFNFRLGAEARFSIFRARGGWAMYNSPYKEAGTLYEDVNNPGTALSFTPKRRIFSLGFGLRQPNYYIDVAYVNQLTRSKLSPYTTDEQEVFDPVVLSNTTSQSFILSVGFSF